jgi:hypothetical protein
MAMITAVTMVPTRAKAVVPKERTS